MNTAASFLAAVSIPLRRILMESIVSFFAEQGLDFEIFLKASGILLLGALLISGILRFIFGKKTLLGYSISSSIAIIFIYVATALILTLAPELEWIVSPLPFADFSASSMHIFRFQGANYTIVAAQLLSMVILSFLVCLTDTWMPKGKNIISWFFWRCLTVVLGMIMHFIVNWLFNRYLPQGIILYAPAILLAILIIMLLTGALKFVVGIFLATVNPVIAAFYTFFFASVVGKQLTKAVLTTGILTGVVYLLQDLGITGLLLSTTVMAAYIPFLILLLLVWYIINKIF